ncbi:MAG: tRNA (adenosine(37)-N6)-threonylcarbamoyltransferase complex ATPase subunit type 1 TsaE [Armatimonadetes bacterium]|nr:tRNA (adenosine(37)-N6)-threonylcarbamoyltransferase complex ATPase subunit type 1 TsaE [Armatimonadota bacterium]
METKTVAETQAVAVRLAPLLRPGDCVTLSGDLGAGKTTWTRGLAVTLGIPAQAVTSPTFTLLHEYPGGRLSLYHVDAYRLTRGADADEIGLADVLNAGDGVVVIEWASHIAGALPAERLEVAFDDTGDDTRTITLTGLGERWTNLQADWNACSC